MTQITSLNSIHVVQLKINDSRKCRASYCYENGNASNYIDDKSHRDISPHSISLENDFSHYLTFESDSSNFL